MKKFNKNLIVFVVVSLMVTLGYCFSIVKGMGKSVLGLVESIKMHDENAISDFTDSIENYSSERLRYHDLLMDINSFKERILGTRAITKDGTQYFRTDDNYLVSISSNKAEEGRYDEAYTSFHKLKDIAEANGANFMYFAVPGKNYYATYEANIIDYGKHDYDLFVKGMYENEVPYYDFSNLLNGYTNPMEAYFFTDHHWKPTVGLQAANVMCQKLQEMYGFAYDKELFNINNYNVTKYKDQFLGSYGKKVGTYFTEEGADDFELITPKFETDLIEEQPFKNSIRTGSFEETVLYMDNLEKDYYGKNSYVTYSGGDYSLQIIKNNKNLEGKKILLIRDSFGCVVSPFLSLQTSELHVCDVRNFESFVGEKVNMEEYIQQIQPDYVLVLYTGTDLSSGRNDFF